jgi:L-alanine-DL-glutamate epimerase-like enolase superfamily enzyme
MVEYLVQWNVVSQIFWNEPVLPVAGTVTVPDQPGIGVFLDESKMAATTDFTLRPGGAGACGMG